MPLDTNRPVFLDLLKIRLPVNAVVSILHRLTGAILVLLIPAMIYVLQLSLSGPEGFARASDLLGAWPARVGAIILLWVLAHHLIAGIRFLAMDLDLGVGRPAFRRSAWAALALAPVAAILLGALL
ncbi:MAG: succinate dehydrogenase, cytochrome b556 subunit [Chromatiales bacterium]|jgi:succinate dehydrogenase / fumarate reductase cytochrome b subunit